MQCAVLFKVIPLTLLLLSSILFMAEVFLYGSCCFGQFTGLFIRLIVFRILLRQFFLQRSDLLFKIFHLWYRARRVKLQYLFSYFVVFGNIAAVFLVVLLFVLTAESFQILPDMLYFSTLCLACRSLICVFMSFSSPTRCVR